MKESGNRWVVLAGGDIADYPGVKAMLTPSDTICCADSGYRHCAPLGVEANLLVGDFDSIKGPLPAGVPRLTIPAEKDYTDTTLAVEEAVARGATCLLLAGVLGGARFDHSLANLQTLASCAVKGIPATVTDGRQHLTALTAGDVPQTLRLEPREGYYFSLFPMGERCRDVSIRGAKYSLSGYTLDFHEARAVSNEYLGEAVEITFSGGTLLVVETPM